MKKDKAENILKEFSKNKIMEVPVSVEFGSSGGIKAIEGYSPSVIQKNPDLLIMRLVQKAAGEVAE